jgi:hypothetical protein
MGKEFTNTGIRKGEAYGGNFVDDALLIVIRAMYPR